MKIKESRHGKSPDLFLIVGLACIAVAGLVIWIKHNGLKENKPHEITTSNNSLEVVSDIFKLLVGY